jgi:hypothetical protein
MPSHILLSRAKPEMVSVSRWAQVLLTHSRLRPEPLRLSRALETMPLQPDLAGVGVHLRPVDLETLAKLTAEMNQRILSDVTNHFRSVN